MEQSDLTNMYSWFDSKLDGTVELQEANGIVYVDEIPDEWELCNQFSVPVEKLDGVTGAVVSDEVSMFVYKVAGKFVLLQELDTKAGEKVLRRVFSKVTVDEDSIVPKSVKEEYPEASELVVETVTGWFERFYVSCEQRPYDDLLVSDDTAIFKITERETGEELPTPFVSEFDFELDSVQYQFVDWD